MIGRPTKPCIFFQKGHCREGNNCKFSHDIEGGSKQRRDVDDGNVMIVNSTGDMNMMGSNQSKPMSKICEFFLKGSCTKQSCKFFHGYAENLQNVKIEKIHEKSLVSMCQISDSKFITADQNLIQIWLITDTEHKIIGSQTFDEKITKVVYSNEKVIVATQIEQMYASFYQSWRWQMILFLFSTLKNIFYYNF